MGLQVYERFLDTGHQLFFISLLYQGGGSWLKLQPEGVYMEELPDPGMDQFGIKKKKAGPFSEGIKWRQASSWCMGAI